MPRLAICACSTYNHLSSALALVRSIRRSCADPPPIFITLVDHPDEPRPGFDDLTGVHFTPASDLDVANLPWLLCKLSAGEVCCMLKPFTIRALMNAGFDTVVYLDTDFYFFSDPQPFWTGAGDADFLVTPHVMSPLPAAEPWTRVTNGQLAHAGVLNAGMFAVRSTPAARAFIETWGELCAGPGAFLEELGGQHEQQFFNWVYTFTSKVSICRDPRVNVAYWNLHERPIRWGGLDGRDRSQWYLDGRPIICFHFSGFAWDRGRLSMFDDRARPSVNANLLALCEFYAAERALAFHDRYARTAYAFDRAGGVPLDRAIRTELKRAEIGGTPRPATWADAGPMALGRMNQTLSDVSFVPRYLEPVLERADLAAYRDPVYPARWLRWVDHGLWRDHAVLAEVYEQGCPFVFHRDFVTQAAREVCDVCPDLEPQDAARMLKADRTALLRRLAAIPDAADLTKIVSAALYRTPAFVPAMAIRQLHDESAHLQAQFPDAVGADAGKFAGWLRDGIEGPFECPDNVQAFVRMFNPEASVARVLGKLARVPHLLDAIRRTGYDRSLLLPLMANAQGGCGYDADDVVIADWWFESLGTQALERVRELLPSEAGDDTFVDYVHAWSSRRAPAEAATPSEAQLAPDPMGVNVFGYFKSPIGLGTASTGLCRALELAGYAHRKLVIPNDAMERNLALDDLFQDFAFNYPRNVVVSYPHIEYQLQATRPRAFFEGRETIAYLAWEQRDFPASWRDRLAPYDRLCALSRFSAESIARGTGRPVDVLPCVVETGPPVPKQAARERFGIAEDAFVVGYVFDAASSIVRKNPWAVVDAVAKALGDEKTVLVLKIGSGLRPDFRTQVADLARRAAAACGRAIVITDYLPQRDVETLLCAMDVYLSLHRAEGFGYTLAEAMLLGVPAVATRYSGNLDFMTDRNSYLVDCRETVVRTREGPFETGTVWAEPDIDHAVALLRQIRADYPEAAERARSSVGDLRQVVSPAAVATAAAAVIEGGRALARPS